MGCNLNNQYIVHRVYAYASSGYVSVGCYQVSNLSPLSPAGSIHSCITEAYSTGYSIAALSGPGSCWGGNNLELTISNPITGGCGSAGQISGNFQVYANTEALYTFLGCYQDSAGSTIASNFIASAGTASYDQSTCGAMAVVQFNLLFGLGSSGSVCFVGNEVATVISYVYTPSCDLSNVNQVFVRTVSPASSISPYSMYQNIGCFKDSSALMIPTFQSFNTDPTTCAGHAEASQDVIFGLENGGVCRSGNSLSSAISLEHIIGCPITGSAAANQVFVRKYCFPGSTTVSSYTGNILTFGCRTCNAGYFCPGNNTEIPCPIDYSTNGYNGFDACSPCDTANGYSTIGRVGQSSCVPIREGYFIRNNTLFYCGTNNRTQHYIGGGYKRSTCRCATGYTGDHCDIPSCNNLLLSGVTAYGASLGSLLLNADSTLIQASSAFQSPNFDLLSVETYLLNLLSVDININGNGQITVAEMLTYLKSRSIYTEGMEVLPLWCSRTVCHPTLYPVKKFFSEAIQYFLSTPKHKFDGSGLAFVVNLTSTFPSPAWSVGQCKRYDSSWRGEHVQTSWNFTVPKDLKIQKVCGYVNGLLNSDFTTDRILTGQQTTFVDYSPILPSNLYKRVYCILVYYLLSGSAFSGFECTVGLFYVLEIHLWLKFLIP